MRKTFGILPVISIIVDGSDLGRTPASIIKSGKTSSLLNLSIISRGSGEGTSPEILAEVAVTGPSKSEVSRLQNSLFGILNAMVFRPAVRRYETIGLFLSMKVNGPG